MGQQSVNSFSRGHLQSCQCASIHESAVAANLAFQYCRLHLNVAHLDHSSGELKRPGASQEGVQYDLASRGDVVEQGLQTETKTKPSFILLLMR